MKIRIFVAALAALFIGAAPAHAATTSQAKRAIEREITDHNASGSAWGCVKLTSTYFRCKWVANWATGTAEGTARVRFYGKHADVFGVDIY